jgi:hypothetical protein
MSNIVNWEYYNSFFSIVNEDEFNTLAPLAEKQVKVVIGTHRWNTIVPEAFYYEQLKDCICMTINKLAEFNKSGAGRGIASVQNDGYSETYVIQTSSQFTNEMQSNITRWLSGTGLVGAYKC